MKYPVSFFGMYSLRRGSHLVNCNIELNIPEVVRPCLAGRQVFHLPGGKHYFFFPERCLFEVLTSSWMWYSPARTARDKYTCQMGIS